MSQIERYRRLRLLVRRLNQQRKQQARRVDLLCNDLIGAQRSFLHRLQDISFVAQFYHALLGSTDVNAILTRAGRAIQQEVPGAGVVFFLRQPDGFGLHACGAEESLDWEQPGPQICFDPALVDRICKQNRACTLDDLLALDAGGDLHALHQYSLVTLPLSDLGRSLGFVLLYRPLLQALDADDVRRLSPAMCGLAQAVRAVRVPLPSRE